MHTLTVHYRPDNYPEWLPWKEFAAEEFKIIGNPGELGPGATPTARPGFAPREPLGKPPDKFDPTTKRNLRRGYGFQVKFSGSGHVVIKRFRIHAQRLIEQSTSNRKPL